MLSNDEVEILVLRILREELDDPDLVIGPGGQLADLPGWDSVNMSSVMIGIERKFSVTFDASEIENLSTIGGLLRIVSEKTKAVCT